MSVSVDPNIFFNSGMESVAVLATQSGSNSVKVHFYEKPSGDIMEQFDISGSQPIVYLLKTDGANVKLNEATSNITIDSNEYRFTNRVPVNRYIEIYELTQ